MTTPTPTCSNCRRDTDPQPATPWDSYGDRGRQVPGCTCDQLPTTDMDGGRFEGTCNACADDHAARTPTRPRPDDLRRHLALGDLGHAGPYDRDDLPVWADRLLHLGLAAAVRCDLDPRPVSSAYPTPLGYRAHVPDPTDPDMVLVRPLYNPDITAVLVRLQLCDDDGTERYPGPSRTYRWHTHDPRGRAEADYWRSCARAVVDAAVLAGQLPSDCSLQVYDHGSRDKAGRCCERTWGVLDADGLRRGTVTVNPLAGNLGHQRNPDDQLQPDAAHLAVLAALNDASSDGMTVAQLQPVLDAVLGDEDGDVAAHLAYRAGCKARSPMDQLLAELRDAGVAAPYHDDGTTWWYPAA